LFSTLRPWSFTRTVATAAGASAGGYFLGDTLHDRSLYRFSQNSDSPVLAQIAKLKREHAVVRDAAERAQGRLGSGDERKAQYLRDAIDALDATFDNAVETVLIASLIPEDVQVHNASSTEIREAVIAIIRESMEEDELDVTEHDMEILVENEVNYWNNRPIESAHNPAYPALTVSGALTAYGRLLRNPPIRWRWPLFTFIPVYLASFFYGLGFGTFSRGKKPDDWISVQFAGIGVRSSIAESIAISRTRSLIQNTLSENSDVDLLRQSASLLGSASRDAHILFSYPTDRQDPLTTTSDLSPEEPKETRRD